MWPNRSATVQQAKADLRRRMLALRAAMTPDERVRQNRAITQRVLAHKGFTQAQTVFCYCSCADEIDTYGILHAVLAAGKILCLPRTHGKGIMEAYAVSDLDSLQRSKYGILEPSLYCPLADPLQIDLCVIPCLAADVHGYRLGYGGGYYDRYLVRTKGVRMVLCAASRLTASVPCDAHDIPCDFIVTEEQVVGIDEA